MGLTYDRIFAPIVNTVLESFTAPEQRTRARAIRQQMAVCEINMLVTRDLSENTCANRLTANRYRGINVTRDAFKCGLGALRCVRCSGVVKNSSTTFTTEANIRTYVGPISSPIILLSLG